MVMLTALAAHTATKRTESCLRTHCHCLHLLTACYGIEVWYDITGEANGIEMGHDIHVIIT